MTEIEQRTVAEMESKVNDKKNFVNCYVCLVCEHIVGGRMLMKNITER